MSSRTESHLVGVVVLVLWGVTLVAADAAAAAAADGDGTSDEAVATAIIKACQKREAGVLGGTGTSGTLNTGTTAKPSFGVFDAHLHLTGRTPSQSGADLVDELRDAGVDGGLLYAVYGPYNSDYGSPAVDANEEVERIISSGGRGRIFGLASLNTSDWNDDGVDQLSKLRDYLDRPGFVGVKLAPPHTCLPLDGPKLTAVLETVSNHYRDKTSKESKSNHQKQDVPRSAPPPVFIHSGTTPFCPTGAYATTAASSICCEDEYVNLTRLEPLIARFARVPWVLLHSGYDFTPSLRTDITEQAMRLATVYPGVYLEVSAMFATRREEKDETTTGGVGKGVYTFSYPDPGGESILRAIKSRGLVNKTMFGSDANWGPVGGVKRTLRLTVEAMVRVGFTEDEVCRVLGGTASDVLSPSQRR